MSWDIRVVRNGEVYPTFRTKFFKANEEHLAIAFANQKKQEKGIMNVKIKEVNG